MATVFQDIDDPTGSLVYVIVQNNRADLFSAIRLDSGSATLRLVSAGDRSGIATITLRATDSHGQSVDDTFTVNVVGWLNRVPVEPGRATPTFNTGGATPIAAAPRYGDARRADPPTLRYADVGRTIRKRKDPPPQFHRSELSLSLCVLGNAAQTASLWYSLAALGQTSIITNISDLLEEPEWQQKDPPDSAPLPLEDDAPPQDAEPSTEAESDERNAATDELPPDSSLMTHDSSLPSLNPALALFAIPGLRADHPESAIAPGRVCFSTPPSSPSPHHPITPPPHQRLLRRLGQTPANAPRIITTPAPPGSGTACIAAPSPDPPGPAPETPMSIRK